METKARELDPRLYLAVGFLREGLPCLFGHKIGVHRRMGHEGLRLIYFDKGFYEPFWNFYRGIQVKGGGVFGLDEEGGMDPPVEKDGSASVTSMRMPSWIDGVAAGIFAWGEGQAAWIRENRPGFPGSNVVVSGHPRFDLRKPKFDPFYLQLGDASLPEQSRPRDGRDAILINTSFHWWNNALPQEFFREINEFLVGKRAFDEYVEYHKELAYSFVELTKLLSSRFPEITIFFRPHPVENAGFYEQHLGGCPNVVMAGEGSVQEYNVQAKVVIHHDCTTGVEAFFHRNRVVSYQPVFMQERAQQLPVRVSEVAVNPDEVFEMVREAMSHSDSAVPVPSADVLHCVKQLVANIDFDAAEMIVAETCKRIQDLDNRERLRKNRFRPGVAARNFAQRGADRIKLIRDPKEAKQHQLARIGKFSGLEKNEVELRLRLFRECGIDFPDVSIKQVDLNTFSLFPR